MEISHLQYLRKDFATQNSQQTLFLTCLQLLLRHKVVLHSKNKVVLHDDGNYNNTFSTKKINPNKNYIFPPLSTVMQKLLIESTLSYGHLKQRNKYFPVDKIYHHDPRFCMFLLKTIFYTILVLSIKNYSDFSHSVFHYIICVYVVEHFYGYV